MVEHNVSIAQDPATLLSSEFSADMVFTPSDPDETAKMRHHPSKDIDCRWVQSHDPVDTEPVITLNAESSTVFTTRIAHGILQLSLFEFPKNNQIMTKIPE
uniref:Uncharacterized protein n=1 Tax=Candidatus Kentrum sp. FW TaxID=2126338 RepID=A0A450TJE3_9GAMM|nr:MAG: hypothetical protein BECKFW1821C_GA0114237_101226 [Candidatus Kentron sp. FW]